jgi:hypothetical protein
MFRNELHHRNDRKHGIAMRGIMVANRRMQYATLRARTGDAMKIGSLALGHIQDAIKHDSGVLHIDPVGDCDNASRHSVSK